MIWKRRAPKNFASRKVRIPSTACNRAQALAERARSPRPPLLARRRALPTALWRCGSEVLQQIFGGICSCLSCIARGLGCRLHKLLGVAARPAMKGDTQSKRAVGGPRVSERTHQNCQKPMQKTISKMIPSTSVTITTGVGGQPSHPMNGFSVTAFASFPYAQAFQWRQQWQQQRAQSHTANCSTGPPPAVRPSAASM